MADDVRQIGETILRQMEEAWNAGDGAAFAAPFTEDADFVDYRGIHHHGRQAIEDGHRHILGTFYRGSRMRYQLAGARPLADDVFLVHNEATLEAPETAGPMAGIHHALSSLVVVRAGEGWKVAAFHNTLVTG